MNLFSCSPASRQLSPVPLCASPQQQTRTRLSLSQQTATNNETIQNTLEQHNNNRNSTATPHVSVSVAVSGNGPQCSPSSGCHSPVSSPVSPAVSSISLVPSWDIMSSSYEALRLFDPIFRTAAKTLFKDNEDQQFTNNYTTIKQHQTTIKQKQTIQLIMTQQQHQWKNNNKVEVLQYTVIHRDAVIESTMSGQTQQDIQWTVHMQQHQHSIVTPQQPPQQSSTQTAPSPSISPSSSVVLSVVCPSSGAVVMVSVWCRYHWCCTLFQPTDSIPFRCSDFECTICYQWFNNKQQRNNEKKDQHKQNKTQHEQIQKHTPSTVYERTLLLCASSGSTVVWLLCADPHPLLSSCSVLNVDVSFVGSLFSCSSFIDSLLHIDQQLNNIEIKQFTQTIKEQWETFNHNNKHKHMEQTDSTNTNMETIDMTQNTR